MNLRILSDAVAHTHDSTDTTGTTSHNFSRMVAGGVAATVIASSAACGVLGQRGDTMSGITIASEHKGTYTTHVHGDLGQGVADINGVNVKQSADVGTCTYNISLDVKVDGKMVAHNDKVWVDESKNNVSNPGDCEYSFTFDKSVSITSASHLQVEENTAQGSQAILDSSDPGVLQVTLPTASPSNMHQALAHAYNLGHIQER